MNSEVTRIKKNCIHIHFCYNIDEFHSTFIARGRNGQKGGLRGPRRSSGGSMFFLSALYLPLANVNQYCVIKSFQSSLKVLHFC